jgi:6-phosphogluconate dehydrogenase
MNANPLRALEGFGQSVWLDFIRRDALDGELQRFIEKDGLSGVTSNPSIFEKAIAESHAYDAAIPSLERQGKSAEQIYEALAIEDIRRAADLLRPIYDRRRGQDGFVSLEVSPHLARDTQGTLAEARRLWGLVLRPNVMIKVPATEEGLPAIERLLAEGINVNITLLFGLPRYRQVADAYLAGISARAAAGQPVAQVASVASFFLSRIDVLVDPSLERIQRAGGPRAEIASRLHGEVAIASAKVAYQIFKDVFGSERFRALAAEGAQVQRLLWASTSAKNPAFSDVKYVEPLIGPSTINTLPLETFNAYRDHGEPAPRLEHGADEARKVLARLADVGIDLDAETRQLESQGIAKFVRPFDQLLDALRRRHRAIAARDLEAQPEARPAPGAGEPSGADAAPRAREPADRFEIGIVGLGVMGLNLLLNISDRGFPVAGYDRAARKVTALRELARERDVEPAESLQKLARLLRRPRAVLLLVPAGKPVDDVLAELASSLDAGDVVIDGGNSHFPDTDRRARDLAAKGLSLLGLGVSGGEKGARHGPSLMPGGPRPAYERVRPIFEAVAARAGGEACVAWLGPGSAGHYVKMVHNGIEYGLMQLIAETYDLLAHGVGLSAAEMALLFRGWVTTEVGGYLTEITARVLERVDERTGRPLIDLIRDVARQKGTGAWTSQDALALGIPVPTIDAAVNLRDLSARPERSEVRAAIGDGAERFRGDSTALLAQLRGALYAAMGVTYAQGFSLLRAASLARGYDLRLEEVARVWQGGCIIRARLLEPIRDAYRRAPRLSHLLADPDLAGEMRAHSADLREAVRVAAGLGIPAPAMMASLSYLEALRSDRLSANLIQAQRDCFGAHTYERVDAAGVFHTEWMP